MSDGDFAGGGAFVFDPSTGGGGGSGSGVQSADGAWTVPPGSAVGDMIYATAAFTGALADNSGVATMPAVGMIIAKPTAVTATVLYMGEAVVLAGLSTGDEYFIGTAGGIVLAAGLPVATGSVIQRAGTAINATTLLLDIEQDPVTI